MRKSYSQKKYHRINYQINAASVRLIDEEGKQIDVMDLARARAMSQETGLDLVEIGPNAVPPVVKLIDYSKFIYQQKKKKQEEKKQSKGSETKEIRFGPFIAEHDLETKLKKAKEFVKDGNKVKFVVKFAGRAITKKEIGQQLLKSVIEKMGEIKVEKDVHMEGRRMIVIVSKSKERSAPVVKAESV